MILSAEIRRNPEIIHGLCRQQTTADGEGHSCYCEEDDRRIESEQRHKELGDDGESRREQQDGEGEDQHRAVGDGDAEMALEVALLRGRKRLVEQHRLRAVAEHERLDLVGLAGSDEERRVGRLAAADDAVDDLVARRFGEQAYFLPPIGYRVFAEIELNYYRTFTAGVTLKHRRASIQK